MLAAIKRSPAALIAIGAVGAVILLGVFGALHAIPPVDRVLNPDARHYWQSEPDYMREIIDYCAQATIGQGGTKSAADTCVDSSTSEAIDRGYLSRAWE